MKITDIRNARDIMHWLKNEGIAYENMGNTAMGDPLLLIHKKGEGHPVMITSGAHAGEPAGVFASLLLLKNWKYKNPLYMVPLRDPFGFQGYEACLSYVLGKKVTFTTHSELWDLLEKECDKLLYKEEDFLLVDIGGVLFTNLLLSKKVTVYVGPRQVEQRVNKILQKYPELLADTIGKRIVFPSNSGPDAENVWDFYRAFSAEISSTGIVADMNRRFGTNEEPNEVKFLRELCDKVQPSVVLDLHEGQGSTYYFFVPDYYENKSISHYTMIMYDALKKTGELPITLDDVANRLGDHIREVFEEPVPGVLVDKGLSTPQKGLSFSTYAGRFGASITFETGRWAPIKKRVDLQVCAATAMLDEMDRIHT